MLENIQKKKVRVTTTRSFLKRLKSEKVGDGLPPLELENGAKCVFEYVLQRPKRVVFEGLMRMVVGNEVGWSRKGKKNKENRKNKEEVV